MWSYLLIGVAIAMPTFIIGAVMGAPYLPTLRRQRLHALRLLNLKPGQTLIDLGCGEGALLIEAAKQGIKGIGYELNPLVYVFAKLNTIRYRDMVTVHLANYWQVKLPPANGIYVFLVRHYMPKLDRKLTAELNRPTKLVSYAFPIPGKKVAKKQNPLYLYKYE